MSLALDNPPSMMVQPIEERCLSYLNAEATVATAYGRLFHKDANAVLTSSPGATQVTVFGFTQGNLPPIGTVVMVWGTSDDHGSYFLPNAKCVSHGDGVLRNFATFVQLT
jgi:hypothetical protein